MHYNDERPEPEEGPTIRYDVVDVSSFEVDFDNEAAANHSALNDERPEPEEGVRYVTTSWTSHRSKSASTSIMQKVC